MSKRIIIIRNANPHDFGGGERFPVFLSQELTKLGLDPILISASKKLLSFARDQGVPAQHGLWWKKQNWSGWQIVLLPIYIFWQIILFSWYLGVFIREKPVAIHIQSKDDFIAATIAGRIYSRKVRIVWTDHADLKHIWLNLNLWYKNLIGKMVYLSAKFTNTITVVSHSEQGLVTKNLKSNSSIISKIVVIYNGIADSYTEYHPKSHDGVMFCTAGRLVTDKGVGEIIGAFRQVSQTHDDAHLTIIGSGPEAAKFHDQSKGLESINFTGHLDNPFGLIADCDIYLHATYHEGFSVSLVEASMLERAIIATDVGGNPEIITDKKTGLLVSPKNAAALAEAMEKLYKDKTLRLRLASNARKQYLAKFQFDPIVRKQFLPLYGVRNED